MHIGLSEDPIPMLALILAPWRSQEGKEQSKGQTPTTCSTQNRGSLSHAKPVSSSPECTVQSEGKYCLLTRSVLERNLSVKQNYTLLITCVWNIVFRNSSSFWVVQSERRVRRSKSSCKIHDAENISIKYKKTKNPIQINFYSHGDKIRL